MAVSGGLYTWETAGLRHHCPVCATPLLDPKAKATCVGIHVEPCCKFHLGLHRLGLSTECFACASSHENHHKRHIEIANAICELTAYDSENGAISAPRWKPRSASNSDVSSISPLSSDTSLSESAEQKNPKPGITKKQRKQERKCASLVRRFSGINVCSATLTFIDEVLHPGTMNPYVPGDKSRYTDEEVAMIQAGFDPMIVAQNISFIPISRNSTTSYVTREKRKVKEQAGQNKTTLGRKERSRQLSGFTNLASYSSSGARIRGSASNSAKSTSSAIWSDEDAVLFQKLNVQLLVADKSKKRRDLVSNIIRLVRADLEKVVCEAKEKSIREAAYWRWVTKDTLNHMLQAHAKRDWATGSKLPQSHSHISLAQVENRLGQEEAWDERAGRTFG